jgi:hypothetical protein
MLIEKLRDEETYSLKADYDVLAYEFHEETEDIRDVIENYGLFEIDNGRIMSSSLVRRMSIADGKMKQRRDAAKSRWNVDKKDDDIQHEVCDDDTDSMRNECDIDANAMRTQCDIDATQMRTQCDDDANAMRNECGRNAIKRNKIKVKENKEKENKENESETIAHAREGMQKFFCEHYERVKGMQLLYDPQSWAAGWQGFEPMLLDAMRRDHIPITEDSIICWYKQFITLAWDAADNWQRVNWSPQVLAKQFTKFIEQIQLKNGKRTGSRGNGKISEDYIQSVIASINS